MLEGYVCAMLASGLDYGWARNFYTGVLIVTAIILMGRKATLDKLQPYGQQFVRFMVGLVCGIELPTGWDLVTKTFTNIFKLVTFAYLGVMIWVYCGFIIFGV